LTCRRRSPRGPAGHQHAMVRRRGARVFEHARERHAVPVGGAQQPVVGLVDVAGALEEISPAACGQRVDGREIRSSGEATWPSRRIVHPSLRSPVARRCGRRIDPPASGAIRLVGRKGREVGERAVRRAQSQHTSEGRRCCAAGGAKRDRAQKAAFAVVEAIRSMRKACALESRVGSQPANATTKPRNREEEICLFRVFVFRVALFYCCYFVAVPFGHTVP
jgi:hypothetical protein